MITRMTLDPRYPVYCGVHFDVEREAVEAALAAYLRRAFGVGQDGATAAQIAEAEAWALDERNWSERMAGVIPLHRCGDHG